MNILEEAKKYAKEVVQCDDFEISRAQLIEYAEADFLAGANYVLKNLLQAGLDTPEYKKP